MEKPGFAISKIILENIRSFEAVEINFAESNSPHLLNVVLGDNGLGKSTLLKCLALGLASPKAVRKLFEEPGFSWLKHDTKNGSIRLEFSDGSFSQLSIELESYGEQIIEHVCTSDPLLQEQIIVCAYGAARRAFGDKSQSRYLLSEAVSTLFNYDTRLQNPELIIRRLLDPNGETVNVAGEEILRWIDKILLLPQGSTRLGPTGLEISGPWGFFKPLGMLGDGYKATLAWVMDFLGWVMYRDPQMLQTGVEGIILVDEIEQHLHPSWQRRIYSLLTKQFPKVQFITTTHSPLCVIGTTDLTDEQVSLIHLQRTENETVTVQDNLKPPRGMRADQVLTSYLFGMETSGDDQTKYEIERLSKLLSKRQVTREENKEIQELRSSLDKKLGTGETELERTVEALHEKVLEENQEKFFDPLIANDRGGLEKSVIELEAKRQLKTLLADL